jgi:hypothetical protein
MMKLWASGSKRDESLEIDMLKDAFEDVGLVDQIVKGARTAVDPPSPFVGLGDMGSLCQTSSLLRVHSSLGLASLLGRASKPSLTSVRGCASSKLGQTSLLDSTSSLS